MRAKLLVSVSAAALASASFATFTAVTSSAALGGNDFIDWGQFGADFTVVASGASGLTNNGVVFHLQSTNDFTGLDDGGTFEIRTQDSTWGGNYAPGTRVLYHIQGYGEGDASVVKISFDAPIFGIGAQLESNKFGEFDANAGYWNPYPTNFIGFSTNHGVSSFDSHNGDAYTGGFSDSAEILEWFSVPVMSDATNNLGSGMGPVDIKTVGVPEPASLAILGIGAVALLRRRRK